MAPLPPQNVSLSSSTSPAAGTTGCATAEVSSRHGLAYDELLEPRDVGPSR